MEFNTLEKMATSIQYVTYYFEEHDLYPLTVGDVIGSYEGFLNKLPAGDLIGIEREISEIYDYHFNAGTLKKLIDEEIDVEDFYGEICIG
jgi:hypothetical protein